MKRKSQIPNYGHLAGKHYITAKGQRIIAGPYTEISDLNAEMRARFPDRRDPKTGEDVFASYYPTVAENRKWDRMNRALEAFNVEYWSVVEDRRVGNHRLIGYPLSRKFVSRQDCRRAQIADVNRAANAIGTISLLIRNSLSEPDGTGEQPLGRAVEIDLADALICLANYAYEVVEDMRTTDSYAQQYGRKHGGDHG